MNKYHSFYSSGGGSISLVDAKSESFFTFVDERSSRLAGGFFVAGGSSATTTRLSSLRVHFSVDDVDKSFSDLIFVFVGEGYGKGFLSFVVVISDSYKRLLFSAAGDVDESADEGEEVGVEDVYCVGVFVDIKSKL